MSYFAIVKAEVKFCHRYPVEHNEFLFVDVQEYAFKPDGESFETSNYIKLHHAICEKYEKKPTILIVRPIQKMKWWQFWRSSRAS